MDPDLCSSQVPVFHPSWDEFKDFKKFMESVEPLARSTGICKIVPPVEWRQMQPDFKGIIRKIDDAATNIKDLLSETEQQAKILLDKIFIKKPLEQQFEGRQGVYNQLNRESRRKFSIYGFKKFAELPMHKQPEVPSSDFENNSEFPWKKYKQLESKYWQVLTYSPTFYGADLSGTLFPADFAYWNIGKLDNLLSDLPIVIPGVNTPYLYFGMWKSTFAWHVEDLDLFSINYVHFGEPKQWFCVPPQYRHRLESLAKESFPDGFKACSQYLRHKSCVISPKILRKNGIPYVQMLQKEGEIMVTFPYAYHSGFNYGFNCAESVNFAFDSWLEIGAAAEYCTCRGDSVKIDMESIFKSQFKKLIPKIKIPLKRCILCPSWDRSDLIPTLLDSRLVHRLCASVMPGVSLIREGTIAAGIGDIPEEYFENKCQICKGSFGAAVPCAHPSCIEAVHPSCLNKAGFLKEDEYQVYCLKHQHCLATQIKH